MLLIDKVMHFISIRVRLCNISNHNGGGTYLFKILIESQLCIAFNRNFAVFPFLYFALANLDDAPFTPPITAED